MEIRRLTLADDMALAASLIYDADPVLYGYWLGQRGQAIMAIRLLMLREDNWFCYRYAWGLFSGDALCGLLSGILPCDLTGMQLEAALDACVPSEQKHALRQRTAEFFTVLADYSDAAYIQSLCVREEYRGQGVGTRLLEAFMAYAKSQGEHKACLEVCDYHPNARRLYERLGFVETGKGRIEAKDVTVYQMEKPL